MAQLMCSSRVSSQERLLMVPSVSAERAGFSLIEMMVALGILAFGILAVTASQLGAMRVSGDSRNRTVAMNLAEQQLEIIETMSPADVVALTEAPGYPNDPANPIESDPGSGASYSFDRSWDIQSDTPEAGVMTVTVTVSWTDGLGKVRSEQIQTLKVDS